jgi:hypothetical protein
MMALALLWQWIEVAAVVAWALVVVLMLLPKRKVRRESAEVGRSRGPVFGVVQPRRSDASAGGLPGKPTLPPQDEGYA